MTKLFLSKRELETYNVEQCSEHQLEKVKELYRRLNITRLMTLKGFYLIFWKELRLFNLNKIHNFEQLCQKHKKYKKHKNRCKNRNNLILDKCYVRKTKQGGRLK